jgi:hypothetical protein
MSLQNAHCINGEKPGKSLRKKTYSVEEIRETPRVLPVEQHEALVYLFKTQSTTPHFRNLYFRSG